MPGTIRPADLNVDRQLLIDLLCRNLSPNAGNGRFDWLYHDNPHGSARVWIAFDQNTGKGMGTAAAFPRRLIAGGSTHAGYVLGDFCIDHPYRSLGLALQLQRACLEQIGSQCPIGVYDFPGDRMMAIYKRMQIAPMGKLVRWSKPLRANRKIVKFVKSMPLTKILAAPVNMGLKWKNIRLESSGDWTIRPHHGNCDEEFTRLAHAVGSCYGICVERSAEYLNWRYLRHPLVRYEILTARSNGELKGYVVFTHTKEDGRIVDFFGFRDTAMWTALVAKVVTLLHARAIVTVSMPALVTHPWAELLKKWGFHPRESSPFIAYIASKSMEPREQIASRWFLMDGDRES